MDQFREIKAFLDSKYDRYNRPEFIETDPIQIPHRFTKPEDIEIAGFFAASFAWGQRKTIIKKSQELMRLMQNNPHEFITLADDSDFDQLSSFCHRTFNGIDTLYFCRALRNIYVRHGGLKRVFETGFGQDMNAKDALIYLRKLFFELPVPGRTLKHIPDVLKGSSAKRLNMFLRWMVRRDKRGVDFGLWTNIDPAGLYIPLDVHSGTVARKLGLLKRRQNDWKAVDELTQQLRKFDEDDPVKYDFALFGMGVNPADKDILR